MFSEQHKRRMRSRGVRGTLRRCFWGSLCLVHIAPLVSTTGALWQNQVPGASALSCALVWLTFTFFALKFVNVPWLRWRVTRSSVLAFIVACGLAHHDASASEGARALLAQSPAAAVASTLLELATRTRRAWPRILTVLTSQLRREVRLRLVACDALLTALAPSLRRQNLAFISIPRAPPAHCA